MAAWGFGVLNIGAWGLEAADARRTSCLSLVLRCPQLPVGSEAARRGSSSVFQIRYRVVFDFCDIPELGVSCPAGTM